MNFDKMKISEIKSCIDNMSAEKWEHASALLLSDSRDGAKKLGAALKTRIEREKAEYRRLVGMRNFERELAGNVGVICGVDEAGRGPLAGPVVAAAVILPDAFYPFGLNDSKKVPEQRREQLYDQIVNNAIAWGVGIVGPQRIDAINILEATKEAMLTAIGHMQSKPDYILLDAVEIGSLVTPHKGIVKGDEKCLSIAAASIIAKVTRDRIMGQLDSEMPEYHFSAHKGYGTAKHYEALHKYGLSVHHRKSFLKEF